MFAGFRNAHPVVFCVLFAALVFAAAFGGTALLHFALPGEAADLASRLLLPIVMLVCSAVLVRRLGPGYGSGGLLSPGVEPGGGRPPGYGRRLGRGFLACTPAFAIAALNTWMTLASPDRAPFQVPALLTLWVSAAHAILTGFGEEALFRGAVLRVLLGTGEQRRKRLYRAALLSAALFALAHSLNALEGAPIADTVSQVLYSFQIGVLFAGIAVRFGTLWPCVVTHAAINLTSLASLFRPWEDAPPSALADVLLTQAVMLPLLIVGLLLLRAASRAQQHAEQVANR
jgi:membrane protease YdiL (CAAX protease family)